MSLSTTMRLSGLGLILVAMSGCSLFRSAQTQPPIVDNGPLAPAIAANTDTTVDANVGTGFDKVDKPVFCTTQQISTLAASKGGKALADAVAIRIFYFDTDAYVLDKDAATNLTLQAKLLAAVPTLKLQVSGHTDERGTSNYNMGLGERRGNAVASLLSSSGVKSDQINVVSFGKEKPAADGHDEAAWSKNRRVELDYTGACL